MRFLFLLAITALALVAIAPPRDYYSVTIAGLPSDDSAIQDYRSLFRIVDQSGSTVCAAGMPKYSQTRRASSSQTVELYCTPSDSSVVEIGRPSDDSWRPALVHGHDGVVDLATRTEYRDGTWRPTSLPAGLENQQEVGGRLYQFVSATADHPPRVLLDGDVFTEFPGASLEIGYYYAGRIYVVTSSGYSTRLWVCDLQARCSSESLPAEMRAAYAMLGYEGDVLIAGTTWIVRFDGERVRTVYHRAEDEFYSIVSTSLGLLVGTYPEGNLLAIDTENWSVTPLPEQPIDATDFDIDDDQIPELAVHFALGKRHYREAQSIALMGGRIYVGMFPWGEVWESPLDNLDWEATRLFPGEKMGNEPWPYYREMRQRYTALADDPRTLAAPKWSLAEYWSQRIHSMVLTDMGLAIGKGNFTGWAYEADRDTFASREALARDYGSVVLFQDQNSLVSDVRFDGVATTLTFEITPDRLRIFQDGKVIATKVIAINLPPGATIEWGAGPYGGTTLIKCEPALTQSATCR